MKSESIIYDLEKVWQRINCNIAHHINILKEKTMKFTATHGNDTFAECYRCNDCGAIQIIESVLTHQPKAAHSCSNCGMWTQSLVKLFTSICGEVAAINKAKDSNNKRYETELDNIQEICQKRIAEWCSEKERIAEWCSEKERIAEWCSEKERIAEWKIAKIDESQNLQLDFTGALQKVKEALQKEKDENKSKEPIPPHIYWDKEQLKFYNYGTLPHSVMLYEFAWKWYSRCSEFPARKQSLQPVPVEPIPAGVAEEPIPPDVWWMRYSSNGEGCFIEWDRNRSKFNVLDKNFFDHWYKKRFKFPSR